MRHRRFGFNGFSGVRLVGNVGDRCRLYGAARGVTGRGAVRRGGLVGVGAGDHAAGGGLLHAQRLHESAGVGLLGRVVGANGQALGRLGLAVPERELRDAVLELEVAVGAGELLDLLVVLVLVTFLWSLSLYSVTLNL